MKYLTSVFLFGNWPADDMLVLESGIDLSCFVSDSVMECATCPPATTPLAVSMAAEEASTADDRNDLRFAGSAAIERMSDFSIAPASPSKSLSAALMRELNTFVGGVRASLRCVETGTKQG